MKIFKILHVVKYLLVVLGIVCLLLSTVMYQNTLEFTKNAVRTTGVVTHTVKRDDVKGSSYSPAIRFQDQQGKVFEFVSSVLVKSSDYKKGEEIEILYDPSNPKGAVIEGFFSVWGLTMMFGYIGIMSLGFGLGSIIWFKKKEKKKKRNSNCLAQVAPLWQRYKLYEKTNIQKLMANVLIKSMPSG